MNKIAYRLKEARKYAGLSQGQVANLLNVHRPTISEIEAGRRRVNSEELVKFSEIYEVSINWLTNSKEDDGIDERIRLAARDLSKLKKDDINKILCLLSSIKEAKG